MDTHSNSSDNQISRILSTLCRFTDSMPVSKAKSDASLQFLEQVFNLKNPRNPVDDPILISIDLEHSESMGLIRQVGIASLDTANLSNYNTVDEKIVKTAISGRLLIMTYKDMLKIQRNPSYLFGTPELAVGKRLSEILLPVLTPVDSSGASRNVVLVGHSIEADIVAMQRYAKFDILKLPSINVVVDTAYISVLRSLLRPLSLEQTCRKLSIHTRQLHNAGNDAMYTLKAALSLFVRYKCNKFLRGIDVVSSSIPEERDFVRQHQLGVLHQIAKIDNRVQKPLEEMREIGTADGLENKDGSKSDVGEKFIDSAPLAPREGEINLST